MAQKSQRIFEGCQSLKTIFIVFKKNEFGHTRISCFFLSYWPNCNFFTAQWARHWSDPQQNRRAERWVDPLCMPHVPCSIAPLCPYYILHIHTVYTYYIHILRSMLIVQAAQFTVYYATHFDCFKTKLCTAFLLLEKLKFENRMIIYRNSRGSYFL